jgi:hypothetical protein
MGAIISDCMGGFIGISTEVRRPNILTVLAAYCGLAPQGSPASEQIIKTI